MSSSTITNNSGPDSDAFEATQLLWQAPGGMIFGLYRRFCGNEDDAADLVQEPLFEAFHSWGPFRGDSKAATWLYHIMASKA